MSVHFTCRPRRWLFIAFWVVVACPTFAQDEPAEAPPETQEEQMAEPQQVAKETPITLSFDGGTVRDLASYLQEATGFAYAVAGAIDRNIEPFEFVAPNRQMMLRLLGAHSRTAHRSGFCIAPAQRQAPGEQPTDFAKQSRPVEEKRDLLEVGPVKQPNVLLKTALQEISDLAAMPIVVEGALPEAPMSVDLPKVTVAELLERLAAQAGMQAKAVYVLYGLTADNIDEVLKYVTDEELATQLTTNMALFEAMSPEGRKMAMQLAYDEFRKLPDAERAEALGFGGRVLSALFGRVDAMQGPQSQLARDGIRAFASAGLDFYRDLPPAQRGELQPIADILTRVSQPSPGP